jgi:hypothetical protein
MRTTLLSVFMVILSAGVLRGFDEIRFLVPEFRPYTYEKDGALQGAGIEAIQRILKESRIPYSFVMVSGYDLAVSQTRSGNADGFFPAVCKADRDSFAAFSGPVIVHRWTWFLPAGSTLNPVKASFKAYARVGTVQNSDTHAWLRKTGFSITGLPRSPEALPVMMGKGTINSILLNEAVFLQALESGKEKPDPYRKVVLFETPLGMYISRAYLERNPGAMESISRAMEKLLRTGGK